MSNSRKLITAVILIFLALVLFALGYTDINNPINDTKKQDTDKTIDFYVENSHTVQYQADGTRYYTLDTIKMKHLSISGKSLLTQPNLLLYKNTVLPWHIRSNKGEVSSDGKKIDLIDHVFVQRNVLKKPSTVLTTTRLTVFPDKKIAQTKQPVKIKSANNITTAIGMKAYLGTSKMYLLSHVRGLHEVN